jgi:hypothetical protein
MVVDPHSWLGNFCTLVTKLEGGLLVREFRVLDQVYVDEFYADSTIQEVKDITLGVENNKVT